jgi:hypothetical protein
MVNLSGFKLRFGSTDQMEEVMVFELFVAHDPRVYVIVKSPDQRTTGDVSPQIQGTCSALKV